MAGKKDLKDMSPKEQNKHNMNAVAQAVQVDEELTGNGYRYKKGTGYTKPGAPTVIGTGFAEPALAHIRKNN